MSFDDDGGSDPFLMAALQTFSKLGASAASGVHAALLDARVFVPVVATLLEADQLAGPDKSSQMELLTLRAGSGDEVQEALLVFTTWEHMQTWRSDVRPVPLSAVDACGVAIERDYDAVIIDIAGPVRFIVDDSDLEALARGYQPIAHVEGVAAKRSIDVDIRRAPALPEFAARAVAELHLDVVALEVEEGDGQWRPAIGIVADQALPVADVARMLAEVLTEAIELVPLTRDQAATL